MRKILMLAATLLAPTALWAEFPERDLSGIIQWGAGGSTDVVMRAVTPYAEELLGRSIVLQNRTGGSGAIATQFVAAARADGYTLLMGAENPQIYKVMGLGDKDYSDFEPVTILARGIPMIVARPDAPFDTFPEMIAYIEANPGVVRMGSTGPGGLAQVVTAMVQSQIPMELTSVPYDGDGPAQTALMSGAVDIVPAGIGAVIENVRAGRVKPIVLVDTERSALLPDVPTILEHDTRFETYLPWGPFFGIFAPKGTPAEAVETLRAAFTASAEQAAFQDMMVQRGFSMLLLSGDEAREYLDRWRAVTSWLIHDTGYSKASPESFGIVRP